MNRLLPVVALLAPLSAYADIQFAASDFSVNETGSSAVVTVTRGGDLSSDASVTYTVNNGSAEGGKDFSAVSGTILFAADDAAGQSFEIPIFDDDFVEGEETATLVLSNAQGDVINGHNTATLRIIDDESVSAGQVRFNEALLEIDEDAGSAFFIVERVRGATGRVRAIVRSDEGSAVEGDDYLPVLEEAVWQDGDSGNFGFRVSVNDDNVQNGNREFNIVFEEVSGGAGTLFPSTLLVRIIDDESGSDGASSISFIDSSLDVGESEGTAVIRLTRNGNVSEAASVNYYTQDGEAGSNEDYDGDFGEVKWEAGDNSIQAITIAIQDDSLVEADERFGVILSGASNADISGSASSIVTIQDNDTAVISTSSGAVSFSSSLASANEDDGSVQLLVTRQGGSAGSASVRVRTSDLDAEAFADYEPIDELVGWNAGESGSKSIEIPLIDNEVQDGNREFSASLSESVGVTTVTPRDATITVLDDEVPSSGDLFFRDRQIVVPETEPSVVVIVQRAGGSDGEASVEYDTNNGVRGRAAVDYETTTGRLIWADGDSSSRTIEIPINSNPEGLDQDFELELFNAQGANLATADSKLEIIIENVGQPGEPAVGTAAFDASHYAVNSGNGTVTLQVNRLGGSAGAASIDFATSDGTALAGTDYAETTGTLFWADGDASARTITVPVITSGFKPDAVFTVALSNAQGIGIGGNSTAVVEITFTTDDNEGAGSLGLLALLSLGLGGMVRRGRRHA